MIGTNWAQDAGVYEFTMGATGKKVKGRYTFVYVYEDGEWKISQHHSSIMPEGIITAEPITETEVRSLFGRWNDALASLDPKKVADRYSSKGVLLPTVSDVPRTDYPGIVDYFTNFLKPQPITEAEVKNLFQLWNMALATEDPDAVAMRYSKGAVLLPTVSDVPRTDYDLIKDYFVGFLKKKPQGEIVESNVMIGHNWCQDAGIYEFTMGASGDKVL